jgi:hypothetical protein
MTVREVSTREDADGSGVIIRCTCRLLLPAAVWLV